MTNKLLKNNNNNNKINVITQSNNYNFEIDELDQKLLELLLKGHKHKEIAIKVKTPLSTIQRRIRKIFENQYVDKKNELNYSKLGLRKGFLQISLKGDGSNIVAQKISNITGITSVSQVIGDFDILCTCIFKDTDSLFKIIENIKTIERVNAVLWSEEVHSTPLEEKIIMPLGIQKSIEKNLGF
jgi:DNA-binding Lrp family transcriptional regulator